ncbi:MAG: ribosome biogenesis GTPase YlqF [Lachnospiraceae bacterium]|nr:ribosome biogenesis GTPase YlqF [Lachnospiraceae bacterium]
MAGNDYGWYPGHMTKSIRAIREELKLVDLCIEVLDARVPLSSRNPDIDELAKDKYRLIVLNKSDLADDKKTALWIEYFKTLNIETLVLCAKEKKTSDAVRKASMSVCREKIERDKKRGIVGRPIRAMVCGIPNVGKSTLINTITGRAPAKTGNKPGVTRSNQWVKTSAGIDLLDTPGLLWPKFEDKTVGLKLASIGSVNDQVINLNQLAGEVVVMMKELYPGVIASRYDVSEDTSVSEIIKGAGIRNGLMLKGGDVDMGRASEAILGDFRSGKLGKITLEVPSQNEQ